MKHTKGEWVAKGTNIFLKHDNIPAYKLARVQQAVYYEVKISKAEAEANTRLMASAPRLLEVLEAAHTCLKNGWEVQEDKDALVLEIEKILAKVKGE